MKTTEKTCGMPTPFGKIDQGGCFLYDGGLKMKMHTDSRRNYVNLVNGYTGDLADDHVVLAVQSEMFYN